MAFETSIARKPDEGREPDSGIAEGEEPSDVGRDGVECLDDDADPDVARFNRIKALFDFHTKKIVKGKLEKGEAVIIDVDGEARRVTSLQEYELIRSR
ncbi:MAG: hypothetical protein Kilf2KO_34940 [Rhodospirillales bacterium]